MFHTVFWMNLCLHSFSLIIYPQHRCTDTSLPFSCTLSTRVRVGSSQGSWVNRHHDRLVLLSEGSWTVQRCDVMRGSVITRVVRALRKGFDPLSSPSCFWMLWGKYLCSNMWLLHTQSNGVNIHDLKPLKYESEQGFLPLSWSSQDFSTGKHIVALCSLLFNNAYEISFRFYWLY